MKAGTSRFIACCALFVATQAHAQLEGSLFTQPDERAYLDYLREEFLRTSAEEGFYIEEAAIPEIPQDAAPAPTGPTEFTFGGIMTRRDGSRSVWLNGRVLAESELPEGISLVNGARDASLRIEDKGSSYVLRPGQSLNLVSGQVMENFQRPPPEPEASAPMPAEPVNTAAEAPLDVQAAAPPELDEENSQNSQREQTTGAAAAEAAQEETGEIAAAVNELSDAEAEALLEALQARRSQPAERDAESDAPEQNP